MWGSDVILPVAAQRERVPASVSSLSSGEKTKLSNRDIPEADDVEVENDVAYFYLLDDSFVMTMSEEQWIALQAE
jgi:hypothetical protein